MPRIKYQEFKFRPAALQTIERANTIIADYRAQGFDLTLRQVYYQFVSRNWITNTEKSYKSLGDTIANGRLAGLIDWEGIVDRTRRVRSNNHWSSPADIVSACADQFQIDKWADQPQYIEVFVEKDAIVGILDGICSSLDVPYYACRGYSSVSAIWECGRNRIRPRVLKGKKCSILYLGDHDPSGIDMTRDVRDRVRMFAGSDQVEVVRLALNMDQVIQYNPPPNPAKLTDSRSAGYVATHGDQSWELDALEPAVIVNLIQTAVLERRDQARWDAALAREQKHRANLRAVADNWAEAVDCATHVDVDNAGADEPDIFDDEEHD